MFSLSGLFIYGRETIVWLSGTVKFCYTIPEGSERATFFTSYVCSLGAPIGALSQNALLEPTSLGAPNGP